jgi:tetratricopeptide (TPR) repeat protein
MVSGVLMAGQRSPRALASRCCGLIIALCGCSLVAACSSFHHASRSVSDLSPLHLPEHTLTVADLAARAPTPDLLATDQEMRDFVELYTGGVRNARQRLTMLHRAVSGAATLDMQYDSGADGTAREVFHRGSANCLSYASLFVALAREAGLEAHYQWLEVRPQWTRQGERVMVRLHVNVVVKLGSGSQYMVDIDPLPSRDIAGSQQISDRAAQALYHSNIAMESLAQNDLEQAWLHGVRALQLDPAEAHLWVNLGAIYRMADQHRDAEDSYLYALQLDPWDRSAMNNLVVLYNIEGRDQDRDYWEQRVARYRDANPFYHAWLGDEAAAGGNWERALHYYEEALALLPDDSRLLYSTGLAHYELDQLDAAAGYIQRAISTATLRSDIDSYQLQLEQVQQQLAGI